MRKSCLLMLFLLLTMLIHAQTVMNVAEPGFRFRDGIFLSHQSYRANKPDIAFHELCDAQGTLLPAFPVPGKVFWKSPAGRKELDPAAIFGYSRKGVFHIRVVYRYHSYFVKLAVRGSIGHFVLDTQSGRLEQTESRQYVFDHETGEVRLFWITTMEPLIKRDEELYEQFEKLSEKEKQQQLFLFLRKYNEKHPAYLPS